MKRITLTQYDSGLPVEIDPDLIRVITPLKAMQGGMTGNEYPCRTRIDLSETLFWLVWESLEEINEAIKKAAE